MMQLFGISILIFSKTLGKKQGWNKKIEVKKSATKSFIVNMRGSLLKLMKDHAGQSILLLRAHHNYNM